MTPGDTFIPWKLFHGLFVPNALARYTGLSPAAKLLYGRLTQFAGKDGECNPKQVKLSVEIGVSERYIRKLLKELEDDGFIRIRPPEGCDRLTHKSCRYDFLWHAIFEAPERTIVPVREDTTVPVVIKEVKEIHKKENQTHPVACVCSAETEKNFETFWEAYPSRGGYKAGKEKAKALFLQLSPEDQDLAVRTAREYFNSDAVRRGIGIMDPANFLKRRDRDTGEITEPWRSWTSPHGYDELMTALRNRENRCMPGLSDGAVKLFRATGLQWREAQEKLLSGDLSVPRAPCAAPPDTGWKAEAEAEKRYQAENREAIDAAREEACRRVRGLALSATKPMEVPLGGE